MFGFCVEHNVVSVGTVATDTIFEYEHARRVCPDEFVPVVRTPEYLVEDEAVPRGRFVVDVPVNCAGRFQDTVAFDNDRDQ